MIGAAAIVASVFIVWLFFRFLLALIYDYRVSQQGIEFQLFRLITVGRVSWDAITTLREVSWGASIRESQGFRTLVLGNRLKRRIVVIETERGFFRNYILTPASASDFLSKAEQQRMHGAPQGGDETH